jgi:glycosidase
LRRPITTTAFYDFQPDLNTSNPYVQAEILKIMGFWLQLGVSGFRMDAVPFVIGGKRIQRCQATKQRPATAQWGHFLRNHDELDLGRLTDTQRKKVFAAFGPDPDMQLYGRGIRRRLAPMLEGDRRRRELAYSLMLTLPGTPVIRYGDEIGMGDMLTLPERNCAHTPMQWSTEPNAGFTQSAKPLMPVIADGAYSYPHINVAAQRRDPDSLLNWMERMIRMRKEIPEIGWAISAFFPQVCHMFSQCDMTGGIIQSYAFTT